jgi:hypothetical protein
MDGERKKELEWAAEFVEKQADFCHECAVQERDPEQKEMDEESADQFYKLALKIRDGKPLDEHDIYDMLWIMHEEFHELELGVEV